MSFISNVGEILLIKGEYYKLKENGHVRQTMWMQWRFYPKMFSTLKNTACFVVSQRRLISRNEEMTFTRFEPWNLKTKYCKYALKEMTRGEMKSKVAFNFRTMKQIPVLSSFEEPCRKRCSLGRPMKDACKIAFEETMKYFEGNDDEQMTVDELVRKM